MEATLSKEELEIIAQMVTKNLYNKIISDSSHKELQKAAKS
ncbi:MAG TPA: hypothetical protein PKD00_03155 [Burkholderiales bacterium]|nr:hypothetical protein [Burkholderiales bacterium]